MLAVKILLAEDVHMIRGALIALLELEPDLRVIASVDRGDKIVEAALASRPDVAVVDIDLPGIDGLTAAAELHQRLPDCRTLILTSLGRPGTLRRALASQVTGFLLKDAPPDQLAQAVRSVAAGRRVIDPQLALAAWDSPRTRSRRASWRCCGWPRAARTPRRSPAVCSCRREPSATTSRPSSPSSTPATGSTRSG